MCETHNAVKTTSSPFMLQEYDLVLTQPQHAYAYIVTSNVVLHFVSVELSMWDRRTYADANWRHLEISQGGTHLPAKTLSVHVHAFAH